MGPRYISGPLLSAAPSKIQAHVAGKKRRKRQKRKQLRSSVPGHSIYLTCAPVPRYGIRKPRCHHGEELSASCDGGQGHELHSLFAGPPTGGGPGVPSPTKPGMLREVLAARNGLEKKLQEQPHPSSYSPLVCAARFCRCIAATDPPQRHPAMDV